MRGVTVHDPSDGPDVSLVAYPRNDGRLPVEQKQQDTEEEHECEISRHAFLRSLSLRRSLRERSSAGQTTSGRRRLVFR